MMICAIPKQGSTMTMQPHNFVMLNFIPSKKALLCPQETVWQRAPFCNEKELSIIRKRLDCGDLHITVLALAGFYVLLYV